MFRRAKPEDSDSLWELRSKSIKAIPIVFYEKEKILNWANKAQFPEFKDLIKENVYLVVEVDGRLIASGFLDLSNRSIEGVYVDPEHHGMGLGVQLLKALFDEGKRLGFEKVTMSSTLNAEKFYPSLGFRKIRDGKYRFDERFDLNRIERDLALFL